MREPVVVARDRQHSWRMSVRRSAHQTCFRLRLYFNYGNTAVSWPEARPPPIADAITDIDLNTRARTAIGRSELSRPLKLAISDGVLKEGLRFFDYGCGRVVNIGYVVNVIENSRERQDALKGAWELAEQLLIVSARLTLDGGRAGRVARFC